MVVNEDINPTGDTLLEAAIRYARLGWAIIPVNGKASVGSWKPDQKKAADEAKLRRRFSKADVTGLAVVLGGVSGGLAVRDFDDAESYRKWAAANPESTTIPTVRTLCPWVPRLRDDRRGNLLVKYDDGELRAKHRQ